MVAIYDVPFCLSYEYPRPDYHVALNEIETIVVGTVKMSTCGREMSQSLSISPVPVHEHVSFQSFTSYFHLLSHLLQQCIPVPLRSCPAPQLLLSSLPRMQSQSHCLGPAMSSEIVDTQRPD